MSPRSRGRSASVTDRVRRCPLRTIVSSMRCPDGKRPIVVRRKDAVDRAAIDRHYHVTRRDAFALGGCAWREGFDEDPFSSGQLLAHTDVVGDGGHTDTERPSTWQFVRRDHAGHRQGGEANEENDDATVRRCAGHDGGAISRDFRFGPVIRALQSLEILRCARGSDERERPSSSFRRAAA